MTPLMPAAALPRDEPERLAAVRALGLLGTPPEARFDAFTRLARTLTGAPMAKLSLLDAERQWLKANDGFPTSETPRDHAFCSHAILTPDQVLVVEDATKDPRFSDNPLVTGEPGIRFYAGAPVRSPSGHPVGALCVLDTAPRRLPEAARRSLADLARGVEDAFALDTALRHLHGLITHDPLTGLLNRRGFDEALARLDPGARGASVLLIDIDGFRALNTLFGCTVGDAALRAVAARLTEAARGVAEVARLEADGFALIAPPGVRAGALARRLLASVGAPLLLEGQSLRMSASAGIARFPAGGATPAELLHAADAALHAAKAVGRGGVLAASGKRPAEAPPLGRLSIVERLRAALDGGEPAPFSLAWQPIVHARTGRVCSHEALVRWPLPDGTTLMPGNFIPVAEKAGLIARLDRWVLREATALAAKGRLATQVSVNLSPANLLLADLEAAVDEALDRSGLPPNRLVLEVTETMLVNDQEAVRRTVDRLRARGILIALDDFGEDASSFNHLRDLPVDKVKLDRRFLRAAMGSERAATVLGGVIRLVRELGAVSIAEGVETAEQAALLRRLGIDAMQGWHFGAPGALPTTLSTRDAA